MLEEEFANPSDDEIIRVLHQRLAKKMEFLRKLARRCIELNKQNTKLKQALKDTIYETCSYSDDCDNCEIGILGQCKIPQAYEVLQELELEKAPF